MNEYIKIRSWHLASGIMSRGGMVFTLCGRWAPKGALTSAFLIAADKSCESCLRNKEIRDAE